MKEHLIIIGIVLVAAYAVGFLYIFVNLAKAVIANRVKRWKENRKKDEKN